MNKLPNTFASESLRRRVIFASWTGHKAGQALIIVLGFVALITVLILVFFSSVMTEKTSAKATASGVNARQLALSAVQLVEGVITKATVPTYDTTIAWASQPGMIRTYGTPSGTAGTAGTPSSAPLAYYKLYSSNNMVITAPAVSSYSVDAGVGSGGDLISNWKDLPALYTDLNVPASASDGSIVFPIVDPRAVSGAAAIEGFRYFTSTPSGSVTLNAADFGSSDSLSGNSGVGGAGALLPMPVQWIYVLRDGTLASPDEPTADPTVATKAANFSGSNAPTSNNPIVGRIAFWTDDDCAKVNLNTASEGTYWDPPICNPGADTGTFTYPQTNGVQEITLSSIFPAQGEYQRYPGHPATTCLSVIFGNALATLGTGTGTSAFRQAVVTAIDTASPQISDFNVSTGTTVVSSWGGTQNSTAIVTPNYNRLYATPDEFNFAPGRTQLALGTGPAAANLTQQTIVQSRFFVTTSSKGSDLNLFGLPRLSIWPVWDTTGTGSGTYPNANNASKRTTLDNAMIHASTLANSGTVTAVDSGNGTEHLMEFTRDTALSPTIDFNLSRNQQLMSYLQNLMAKGVPGFGGNFAAKYPAPSFTATKDSDQILTEIFDYIRCTNLADQSLTPPQSNGNVCLSSYTPSSLLQTINGTTTPLTANLPVGQVVPTQGPGTARGFGRFSTLSELALVVDKVDDRITGTLTESSSNHVQTMTVNNGGGITTVSPASQTLIEWALIPNFFCPMTGFTGLGSNLRVQFTINGLSFGSGATPSSITASPTTGNYTGTITSTGLSTIPFTPDLFDGASPAFSTGTALFLPGRLNSNRDSVIGGVIGPMEMLTASGSFYPNGLVRVPGTNLLDGSANGGTMTISSGTITVKIYSPAGAAASPANLIQTLNFTFPSTTVPIPLVATSGFTNGYFRGGINGPIVTGTTSTATSVFTYGTNVASRTGGTREAQTYIPISGGQDVARSLVPNANATLNGSSFAGDLRLISLLSTVPATAFMPALKAGGVVPTGTGATPDYNVDQLRSGSGSALGPAAGFAAGTVVVVGTTYGNTPPQVPAGIPAVTMTGDIGTGTFPGDWDNGPGLMCDGPYCNKPDEGQTAKTGKGIPYMGDYQTNQSAAVSATNFFSPNRQISSAVMFGSLLVGPDHPWRTLLFRPATLPGYASATSYTHPGNNMATASASTAVPDHLLLDLFRMPIVEPYAISDALSTAGQVNLNTQIAPFTYITRTTGMRAVMKSVLMAALPATNFIHNGSLGYKYAYPQYQNGGAPATRYCIDMDSTLAQVNASSPDSSAYPEFNRSTHTLTQPNFFVSASQICDVPLIPFKSDGTTGYAGANLSTFWQANPITGDNSLERPYSLIYPRVTTRSNTFTVHVRAQALTKLPASLEAPTTWTEGTDQVTGEYRGSFTIEKYFDPNSATITDKDGNIQNDVADANLPATAAVRGALWRLLYDKRFGQ